MDPRRYLILGLGGLLLSGCAMLRPAAPASAPMIDPVPPSIVTDAAPATAVTAEPQPLEPDLRTNPAASEPEPPGVPAVGVPYLEIAGTGSARPDVAGREVSPPTGRRAIAAANAAARAPSRADAFVGGVQVFAWSPGRVFEVWTAPLRVTTLTLGPGETILSKAAGDTVRWQIGEASSGSGAAARTHVMLKPLQRSLETNLILTTNRRVYLIELKSGAPDGFNAAVAWDGDPQQIEPDPEREPEPSVEPVRVPDPVALPQGLVDARYRVEPQGRRARWTPTAVFNDGQRTFITFDPDLQVDEAPALFVIAPDGERQLVNYRQQGGLFIVDRVFDRAELRLGDRRPQIVRILRLSGARS